MNKAELINVIADRANVSKKQAEDMVHSFVDIVTETLKKGDEVTIAGFGAWSAKKRASRMGVNPQNPSEKIRIPEVTVPKFKAGKGLKDALKGKRDNISDTDSGSNPNPEPQTPSNPEPSVPSPTPPSPGPDTTPSLPPSNTPTMQ